MSIRTRRAPLSMFVLLFSALSTPLGCTAILGEFEVDGAATNAEAGAPEASTPDAPEDETSAEGGRKDHFRAKLVTAGARHTCALTEQNEVYCWGDNTDGQLAPPRAMLRSARPTKVDVPPNVKSLVAGAFHTCVVTDTFEAFCWGRNDCGQAGAGDMENPSLPRVVVPPSGGQAQQWTVIAPGVDHTCAIEAGGATYCWGCNTRGQAGNIGVNPSSKPVNAGNDKGNATAASAGAGHTCIISALDQRVRCWGSEQRGALGNGPPASEGPVGAVIAETNAPVTTISVSVNHSCAIDANKIAACWGDNGAGQIGNPDAGALLDAPGSRVAGGQALAIAAGGAFTCVIAADSVVRCSGTNANGELGRSGATDTAPHPVPEPVVQPGTPSSPIKAKSIAAGREHACAVLETDEVVCWGTGADGQLGNGTAGGPGRTTPVHVLRPL